MHISIWMRLAIHNRFLASCLLLFVVSLPSIHNATFSNSQKFPKSTALLYDSRHAQKAFSLENQSVQNALVQLSRTDAMDDRNLLGRTRFAVNKPSHSYSYDLDPTPTRYVLSGDDPYGKPLEALIRLESIRRDFESSVPNENFWRPRTVDIQSAIDNCIDRIDSSEFKFKPKYFQDECSKKIEAEFQNLDRSIQRYASVNKLKRIIVETRDAIAGYRIVVKTDPPKIQVHIMTLLQYKKYQYLNVPADKYQWNDLFDPENVMIGWYHYRVDWPKNLNGPEEGNVEITKPGVLTFTPKSN
jgi:hypothetical protein